ncbi:SNF2 family N-terminal domain-containing protein [Bipolaris maydis]|nr:SNF2 family N-terminal domain-containing protein [Bipolaris maydis]
MLQMALSKRPASDATCPDCEPSNTSTGSSSAFKHAATNLWPPPDKEPQNAAEAVAAASQMLDNATRAGSTSSAVGGAVQETRTLPRLPDTFSDPWSSEVFRDVNYISHTQRKNRPYLATIMPQGVDINAVQQSMEELRKEREILLYNRLTARKAELEKIRPTLPKDDGKVKLALVIEQKKLNLLEKQRKLRREIAQQMIHADNLAMTANRTVYRRLKKHRCAKPVSPRNSRSSNAMHARPRKRRSTTSSSMPSGSIAPNYKIWRGSKNASAEARPYHGFDPPEHREGRTEAYRANSQAASAGAQVQRRRDLPQALGPSQGYSYFAPSQQTDGFLKQLANSVKAQQRSANNSYEPEEESSSDESDDEDRPGKRKTDYYEIAHRIKEEVTEQATNLVGGTLKEYQLKDNQFDHIPDREEATTWTLPSYCPLSTLTNWTNEFEKWAPSVSKIVYKGPPNARKQYQQQIRWGQFQVLLTTYEFIIKDRPILSKIKWVHMIVDEGHRMKERGFQLSMTITQYYSTRYRLILTGTPLQNNLTELWAMLNFRSPYHLQVGYLVR